MTTEKLKDIKKKCYNLDMIELKELIKWSEKRHSKLFYKARTEEREDKIKKNKAVPLESIVLITHGSIQGRECNLIKHGRKYANVRTIEENPENWRIPYIYFTTEYTKEDIKNNEDKD